MNTPHILYLEITTNTTMLLEEVNNTVSIDVQDIINALSEDQYGILTPLGTYLAPLMFKIRFNPHRFSPRHISRSLRQYIRNRWIRRNLSEKIASDCAHLPKPLHVYVSVKVIKEVRITLPAIDAVVPPTNVFQRLLEENMVNPIYLGEEEKEASCCICMEDFSESSSGDLIKMPKCLHLFHEDCIFEWLRHQNTCPLCRHVPYEEDVNEN